MFAQMGDKIDAVTVLNTRPHARLLHDQCDATRQARLLPKAAHPHDMGIASGREDGQRKGPHHPPRQSDPLLHQFYRTAVQLIQSGKIGKVTQIAFPGSALRGIAAAVISIGPRRWIRFRKRSIGTSGSVSLRCARIPGRDVMPPGDGVTGRISAVGPSGTLVATFSIQSTPRSTSRDLRLCPEHSGMNDEVWPAQTTYSFTVPGTEFTAVERLKITWYSGGIIYLRSAAPISRLARDCRSADR